MTGTEFTAPVIDSVPKIDNEVAVGEDLDFQRRWWRFEKITWAVFGVLLLLTILGVFGRGPVAKASKSSLDANLQLKYDRIQRTGTPSDLDIEFGPSAIHNGQIRLFLSESIITKLGALRISPQPLKSEVGSGGVTYTFPANHYPANVVISMAPSGPGSFRFTVLLPDEGSTLSENIIVVP